MISVEEALNIVLSNLVAPSVTTIPIADASGRVLADEVRADRDFPPFDRVTMDGIAISFERWQRGQRSFVIEHTQPAGSPEYHLADPAHAVEVMTGAVLPKGTDTVIRYEDLIMDSGGATVNPKSLGAWDNVHRQGVDSRKGNALVSAGTRITPAEIAIMASVGMVRVRVFEMPRTAVVSGGDELVAISDTPRQHQIRRSNSYAVEAAMKAHGWDAAQFHFRDDRETLRTSLRDVLAGHDILVLSGGVSQGKLDFIPAVLEELGIQKRFHKVSQRPGKPFWFGRSDEKVVFALPGNPVSTFMCFYKYILPWYRKCMGMPSPSPRAVLASDFSFAPQLTYYLQVKAANVDGCLMASPRAGAGSGDFISLAAADGFLELPADRAEFRKGEVFPYIPFRH